MRAFEGGRLCLSCSWVMRAWWRGESGLELHRYQTSVARRHDIPSQPATKTDRQRDRQTRADPSALHPGVQVL